MNIYSPSSHKYYHMSDIPKTLRPYYGYRFSSGGTTGEDFRVFAVKFKNVIKKLLPDGYNIKQVNYNHYEMSIVVTNPCAKLIYVRISDVRFWQDAWLTDILIRGMADENDWSGRHFSNKITDLFTFTEDIQKIHPIEN